MKKILFIMMCMIVLASCTYNGESSLPVTPNNVTSAKFYIIEIDGCEYVIGVAGHHGYMAHKGNCKYCAERNKHNN